MDKNVEILVETILYEDVILLYDTDKNKYKEDIKRNIKDFCEQNNVDIFEVLNKLNNMAKKRDKSKYPKMDLNEICNEEER